MCATLRAAFSISSSFILGASLAVACLTGTAKAEVSVADFYKANPISIVVGYAPGGGKMQIADPGALWIDITDE
jgi:hypothetical protein